MLNVSEAYQQKAQAVLPKGVADYIEGGVGDESTIKNNLNAFKKYDMKRLVDSPRESDQATGSDFVGINSSLGIAPMAFHQVCNPACSEFDTALAATRVNVPMVVPVMSTVSLERIAEIPGSELYLQMHLFGDLQINVDLAKRAEVSGYKGLVISIDVPFIAKRPRDIKNKFEIPFKSTNLLGCSIYTDLKYGPVHFFRPHASWDELAKLISSTTLPVYLKGLINKADAIKASSVGAKGIIVSNHGGRQADGVAGVIDVLPEIVDHAKDLNIWIDGGVRSGKDIFIALALGAKRVLLGRPVLWALSVDGQFGVESVLKSMLIELGERMRETGCQCISDINAACLTIAKPSDCMGESSQHFEKPESFLRDCSKL